MKEIIALKGRANSGKTTAIKEVFEILKIEFSSALYDIIKNDADITVIIAIDGIKIGIESQGDPNSRLKGSLKIFQNENCEIIICATRTRGMTVRWVRDCSGYNVEWIHQSYVKEEKYEENMKSKAKIIIDKIKRIMNT